MDTAVLDALAGALGYRTDYGVVSRDLWEKGASLSRFVLVMVLDVRKRNGFDR